MACLLLVFGIPAAGKSLLAQNIPQAINNEWIWLIIHFDDFYPPDRRDKAGEGGGSGGLFDLKECRHKVLSHLEVLFSRNYSTSMVPPLHDDTVHTGFDTFLQYLNSQRPLFDDSGRLKSAKDSVVFVLDDNMPLRSMRHEYYKVARKYRFGFCEVCVSCSLSAAMARNALRTTPIPNSTVVAMEKSFEFPDPAQHHWERRCAVIVSKEEEEEKVFIMRGCDCILPLVKEALEHPVLPMPTIDPDLQETSRAANLDSCVHQADILLRKCVSDVLKGPLPGDWEGSKPDLAQKANLVKRSILSAVRSGEVPCDSAGGRWEVDMVDFEKFQDIIMKTFQTSLHSRTT